ncbi:hypothetical protein U1Q18_006755 [Sarracenia purpurea var. burkii]
MAGKDRRVEDGDDSDDGIAEQITCITLHKRESTNSKRGEGELKHGLWRQEQKTRAARLEKQLKARCALEELIEEQLNHFDAHFNRPMVPTRLKDVAELLMPRGVPAHEMVVLSWLGDWRPSAILSLLRSLASLSPGIEQALSQLIHEIGIEEAVLDEEMAEIQANCVLHLPFGPAGNRVDGPGPGPRTALASVRSEFKKIHRVITKAQNLRFKALELAVKKVLSQADAAEFLVAFVGIQESIHRVSVQQKLRKGPVSVPVKVENRGI